MAEMARRSASQAIRNLLQNVTNRAVTNLDSESAPEIRGRALGGAEEGGTPEVRAQQLSGLYVLLLLLHRQGHQPEDTRC